MDVLLLVGVMVVMLAVRTPIAVVVGVTSAMSFWLFGGWSTIDDFLILVIEMAGLSEKNVLLAIPFFVVSGAVMGAGAIARRLVDVADVLVGWMRGGLAVAAVLSCVIFAAISGSSPVTLIAVGGIMFPAMVKAGYKEGFSCGLIATAGSLGALLPPSIPMIVYSVSAQGNAAVDLADLYLAGLTPGAVIAVMLAGYSVARAGVVQRRPLPTLRQIGAAVKEGIWALLLPVIVLGGIYSGFFTATEAAAVSVVYSLAVELLIHRELDIRALPKELARSATIMGALLLIIVLSFGLSRFMVEKNAADAILGAMRGAGLSAAGFLFALNVFLIVTGCLMDSISAIVLFVPLFAPAAVSLGVDPVHLGVIFIVNMEIGYVAPPIATNLFVAAQLFNRPFGFVVRSVLPSLAILGVGLLVTTYVPFLSLAPVAALRGRPTPELFALTRPPPAPVPSPVAVPDGQAAPDAPDAGAGSGGQKVMSLEEMMRLAREQEAAAGGGTPSP